MRYYLFSNAFDHVPYNLYSCCIVIQYEFLNCYVLYKNTQFENILECFEINWKIWS